MKYKIFGCRVNKYYLNKRLDHFSSPDFDSNKKFLIATCVVTDRAKNKRLNQAKTQLIQWNEIYITWCGVFDRWKLIKSELFYSIYPELKKFSSQIFLLPENPKPLTIDYWLQTKNIYTKKFIVIQNGCDNYCTFCLTVLKRWKHYSRPAKEIIQEIKEFEKKWWKEIVLTGINLAARWCSNSRKPKETKFPQLLKQILSQTKIPRIRISSLGPEYLNDEFFKVISDPRILPYFHLSIQSFSDNVLKSMKRNYDVKYLDSIIKKFQKLKFSVPVSIWADLIIGFPWETNEDFLQTLNSIKKYWISKIHAFPFSAHNKWETIPASKFNPQISSTIKIERKNKLKKIADEVREKFISSNKWKKHSILIEDFKDGKWQWRTENYIQVKLDWNYKKWQIIKTEL